MNPTAMRFSSPDDLLAVVPTVFGFHPQDSLVLVVLHGRGGPVHARVDLVADEDEMSDGLLGLLNAAARSGASHVVLIAYTDDPLLADEVTEQATDALVDLGVDLVWAMRADGSRWYGLDCDEDCCPTEGRPYDLSSHPITAQSVLEGKVTYRNRRELADSLVGTDTDDMEAVAEAADEAMRRFRRAGVPADLLRAEGLWVRDRVRSYLATQERLDAHEAGRMAVAMASIPVRDVAWSEMNRFNARTHVELWRDLSRRTPLELRAAPAALLAFAAWLSGDGALAWCAVERCQEAEPGYSLAGLLTQALTAAVPPSTWRPVRTEDLPLFGG